jgi:hypothetical protein
MASYGEHWPLVPSHVGQRLPAGTRFSKHRVVDLPIRGGSGVINGGAATGSSGGNVAPGFQWDQRWLELRPER